MTEIEKQVQEYLEGDRQWTRNLRLSHARMKLSQAKDDHGKTFWKLVIKANSQGPNYG